LGTIASAACGFPSRVGSGGGRFLHVGELRSLGQYDVFRYFADRPAIRRWFPFPLFVRQAIDGGEKFPVGFIQPLENLGAFLSGHSGIGGEHRDGR